MPAPRLALAHEWIQARAGSETFFERLASIYPNADLFALSHEPSVFIETNGRPIETTFLDHRSLRQRRNLTLPIMPLAWRALGRSRYDAVISSQHAFAHANRLADGGVHLVYVHSPARYIWTPELDGRAANPALAPARTVLKHIDVAVAKRVTAIATNSTEVADRVRRFWKRDATVILSPARVEYFAENPTGAVPTRDYVLGVGRWIPYKNLHLVVDAASRAGLPVKIAGRGPDKHRIEESAAAAGVPVEIIESPSDAELRELYRNAAALVFPTFEDFGLVPVEAQAAGTPVVALGAGGALDTVVQGSSGVLTETVDIAELADGIRIAIDLKADDCRASANRFTLDNFAAEFTAWAAQYGVNP
jgi:glycosyltransferase involved in cell wall biosynthesis